MFGCIFLIIIILFSLVITIKQYKVCENTYEKIILILMYLILLSPTIIYYLDFYNMPSTIGRVDRVDTQVWLFYIMNYLGTIISAIIGAVVLVYMTMYQINKNNEDNEKRDKENLRIQNMPLLKYKIDGSSKARDEKII